MNNSENDFVMAFDHFYTTNHIQILKTLAPFLGDKLASLLPVFVKYLELKHTIDLLRKGCSMNFPCKPSCSPITSIDKITPETLECIYQAVHCYLTPEEDKQLLGIRNLMQTMANFREMHQMMELMKMFTPDSDSQSNNNGMPDFSSMDFSSMDMLSGLLGNSSSVDLMNLFNNLNL